MFATEINTKIINLTQTIAKKSVINIFGNNAIHGKLLFIPESINENGYSIEEETDIHQASIDANNSKETFDSVDSLLYDLNN